MFIVVRVKELEGRVLLCWVFFVGSDGENIWYDFDNWEEVLVGDMCELKLVEDVMDVDKENNFCFVVWDRVLVKLCEGGVEKMEGIVLVFKVVLELCKYEI